MIVASLMRFSGFSFFQGRNNQEKREPHFDATVSVEGSNEGPTPTSVDIDLTGDVAESREGELSPEVRAELQKYRDKVRVIRLLTELKKLVGKGSPAEVSSAAVQQAVLTTAQGIVGLSTYANIPEAEMEERLRSILPTMGLKHAIRGFENQLTESLATLATMHPQAAALKEMREKGMQLSHEVIADTLAQMKPLPN